MSQCRYFSGYKPCRWGKSCEPTCDFFDPPSAYIIVIHLESLGSVLRSTSLLWSMKRKYPGAHITWVTRPFAAPILKNNPFIDRVLTTANHDISKLSALEFDVGFCIDKSLEAGGIVNQIVIHELYGFRAEPRGGAIVPANSSAEELWNIGLNNDLKFFVNQKSELQLQTEALELGPYQRDPYIFEFGVNEKKDIQSRKRQWRKDFKGSTVVGINIGCSPAIPYKRLSVQFTRALAEKLREMEYGVVLLGGQSEIPRARQIACGLDIIESSMDMGIRDGFVSVAACDLVISGDTFGMHMAIACKVPVVAWFGPTCSQEIDLFGRGVKLLSKAQCGPCWKRSCQKTLMCYDLVSMSEMLQAVNQMHRQYNLKASSPSSSGELIR